MNFDEGQSVTTEVEFRTADGTLFDPTTVTLNYRSPTGITGSSTPALVTTGKYRAVVSANVPGVWRYRWAGQTGSTVLVDEGSFCVEDSAVLA